MSNNDFLEEIFESAKQNMHKTINFSFLSLLINSLSSAGVEDFPIYGVENVEKMYNKIVRNSKYIYGTSFIESFAELYKQDQSKDHGEALFSVDRCLASLAGDLYRELIK